MPKPTLSYRIKKHLKEEIAKAESSRAAVDYAALYEPGDRRRVDPLSYGYYNLPLIQAEARKHAFQELDRWITGLEIDRYYEECRLNDLDSGD